MRAVSTSLSRYFTNALYSKHSISVRHFKHIPQKPIEIAKQSPDNHEAVVDEDIMLLERLSLVDFGNRQGVERLSEAIKFANSIKAVKTAGVDPLYTVQEDRSLRLRPDEPLPTPSVDQVLSCAAVTEDDYFVAPPGNVPLEISTTYREEGTDRAEPQTGSDSEGTRESADRGNTL
ncbi:glutamyl-tRNA(Gln) amidotransferase subunit C, mitochondrial-like [Amphibalanus amphitrite]|uniref:glutamyl-tRNA(Gln) amidotransferase subunit C, mitochondrial-like n=1 Tax=Amphibalanus amphitrite TaxID=1232801 RepID=UPI001C8FBC59|nr:glutamyl-tRNA(Gln) amidotransferase subunit C, mitochondrial-like [Amphibalanus amphitrite]